MAIQLKYVFPDGSVMNGDPKLGPIDQMHDLGRRILNHVPYYKRDHDNDSVKPEQSHRINPRKPGDNCRCRGMNPNCLHCGGNGVIP